MLFWITDKHRTTSNSTLSKAGVECELNKLQEPEGSTPLHEIVEEYANDQDAFVRDFIPVFEKMLANGYER